MHMFVIKHTDIQTHKHKCKETVDWHIYVTDLWIVLCSFIHLFVDMNFQNKNSKEEKVKLSRS